MEFITDASMKLDLRYGAPRNEPAERVQNHLDPAMQGNLVHLVERPIHQQRKVALDLKILPPPQAHETTDGGILAERYQRTKIPVEIRLQRFVFEPAVDLLEGMGRLLMGRLGAGRNGHTRNGIQAACAIADRENVGIQGCLKRWQHDKLVAARDLEPIEIAEKIRTPDACGPNNEFRGNEFTGLQTDTFTGYFIHPGAGAN